MGPGVKLSQEFSGGGIAWPVRDVYDGGMENLQSILLPAIVFGVIIFLCTPLGAKLMGKLLKAMNLEAQC
ncbi:MAG: hypothetical protein D6E12_14425 [Desulfovibrio sp.]|nr:MAG: hypothetical protein D6E12_14425 [Desulfovibrio sp.]